MSARVLTIVERHLRSPALASLANFTCVEGEEVDSSIMLTQPDLSLYCFDDETKRAIFVQLPPGIDLSRAPFVWLTQGEQAEHLIAVPYDAFLELASSLPEVGKLIAVYGTGRSGSILLSHAFNELDIVMSPSEPDAASQFVLLRDEAGGRDTELRTLMERTVRFLFKPNRYKNLSVCALKYRNEFNRAMGFHQTVFPQVKNLLLYRDAIGWVASSYRLLKSLGVPEHGPLSEWLEGFEQGFKKDVAEMKSYLGEGDEDIPLVKVVALWWLFHMEACLRQHNLGVRALTVRYDDLNIYREPVLREIFATVACRSRRSRRRLERLSGTPRQALLSLEKTPRGATACG